MTREKLIQMSQTEEEVDKAYALEMRANGTLTIVAYANEATGTYKNGKIQSMGKTPVMNSKMVRLP